MSYPYPKYNDEADTEAHGCGFLTTWQANHISQQLSKANANKSKIAEFRLSLHGQLANWYSQHEAGEFEPFKTLNTKFIRLFHRQVPQRELMSQFFAISHEAHETAPQFIIRFQNLRRQLARKPPKDDVKETFFSALREPLRTTLAVFDFKEQSLEQVIDKALLMDKTQTCNNMSMMSLQKFVPMAKELRFRQGHTMHDMFKSRAFYSRMHSKNTLPDLPFKGTYSRPM